MAAIAEPPKVRLGSLTGLRAAAAFLVFAHHIGAYLSVPHALTRLTAAGIAGVSFFFILSGFVLAWSYDERSDARTFYRRRVARIVPVYLASSVAGIALGALLSTGWRSALYTAPSLLLIQSWIPDSKVYFAGNSVSWSLSCEAAFYLAFPVINRYLRRRGSAQLRVLLAGTVAGVLALALALHPRAPNGPAYFLLAIFPPVRVLEFISGMLLAILIRRGARSPLPFRVAFALAVAVYVVANFLPLFCYLSLVTMVPFMLLISSAASADLQRRHVFSANRVWTRLGEWSYSFYLFHLLVIRFLLHYFRPGIPWFGTAVIDLAVALAVAGVVWRYLEMPLERRLRGVGPPRLD